MSSQHILDLYIHPDKGPIKPIKLDLMEIEVAVYSSRMAASNPDEERVRQMASRITQQFPHIDPASNRQGLATILSRLTYVFHFNGIVLRLAGTIKEDSAPSSEGVKHLSNEVDALAKEVPRLKRLLEIEQQTHRATKEQVVQLEIRNKQLERDRGIAYDKNKTKIDDLQEQVRQKIAQTKRISDDADKIEREKAALQTQYDQLKMQHDEVQKNNDDLLSRLKSMEDQLVQLRLSANQAKGTEKDLHTTIEERDSELENLKAQLNKLMQPDTLIGGSDDFSTML